jgi:UDP-N-acetylmuramoyl-tripeptide--D-alanyl-D-alanine ligase
VGIAAGQAGIYALFCAGTLAEEYARAAAEVNMECEVLYFPEREAMTEALCNYVREGDTILVKASHFMEFPKVVEALCALAEKGE